MGTVLSLRELDNSTSLQLNSDNCFIKLLINILYMILHSVTGSCFCWSSVYTSSIGNVFFRQGEVI